MERRGGESGGKGGGGGRGADLRCCVSALKPGTCFQEPGKTSRGLLHAWAPQSMLMMHNTPGSKQWFPTLGMLVEEGRGKRGEGGWGQGG